MAGRGASVARRFGACRVAVFGSVQIEEGADDDSGREDTKDDVKWPSDVRNSTADVVVGEADNECPGDAAGRVENQEVRPRHLVGSGEESGVGAKDGDKASDEHDLAAVLLEDVTTDLQAALVETNVLPVAA